MLSLTSIWISYLICAFFNFKLVSLQSYNDSKTPSPIILVPGDGGSRAYSDIDYHLFTRKTLVWVNLEFVFFPKRLCEVFKLIYDPHTHKTSDAPFSKVFFPGWGSTETIEELDEWKHDATTYFAPLVNFLLKDKFYIRNKTVRGAPFDFRKAPNENDHFVPDLKNLIEDTYKLSNNRRVVILAHSLGSLYSLLFLKKMDITWKKKYVRSFIAVSGPLGGAVKSVFLETSGFQTSFPINPIDLREMVRTFPSTAFLLPRPEIYGKGPIVITPTRNYSAYDYKSLFEDMKMPYGSMMYDDTKDLVNVYETPEGVDELYCVHGYGLPTIRQMIFKSFPDKSPESINGDGDSVVNIQSLEVCKKWNNIQYFTVKGADHQEILQNSVFLNKLKQILHKQT